MRRQWLVDMRTAKNMSQDQLGEKVGVTNKTISSIEVGAKLPSLRVAVRMANVLGFKVSRFFDEEEVKTA